MDNKRLSHWNGVPCSIASTDTAPCVLCGMDSVLLVSYQRVPACMEHYRAVWLQVCLNSRLPVSK